MDDITKSQKDKQSTGGSGLTNAGAQKKNETNSSGGISPSLRNLIAARAEEASDAGYYEH